MPGDREQVPAAHPGGQQRLMRVAERGVGDRQRRLVAQLPRELLRAEGAEPLPRPAGRRKAEVGPGKLLGGVDQPRRVAVRAVDRHVGQVGQQLGTPVGGDPRGQQRRVILDERGGDPAGPEVGIVEHRGQERDVGRHAADTELGQRPAGPADRGGQVRSAAGELDQQRVVVGLDLGAEGGAAVQPYARAAGRPVGGNAAGGGPEAVGGVLGGDAALQRGPAHHDRLLRQAHGGQRLASRDAQLGLHQVDVGDLLGHRVLDLDAGVHLDEHVAPGPVDEELHRARVDVADRAGERHGVGADPLAQSGVQVRRGRDFHHLLMPALHRAVPVEQVDHVARGVREDLHLDVPRVDDRLLQVHGGVTERGLRFPHRGPQRLRQLGGGADPAHAASPSPGHRLDEHRELHGPGRLDQDRRVSARRAGRHHRQPGRAGRGDRPGLVARQFQDVRGRPDEGDPGPGAALGEIGVLGQEPVPRVDRVGARGARGREDLGDRQVRPDRVPGLADLEALVGLEPVQRVAVLPREDRDRLGAEFDRRPERAYRDLAAVGDQDL